MASKVSWKLGTWDIPAYSRKGSWRPEGGRGAHHHHHRQTTSTTFLSTIGDEGLYNSCDKSLKTVLWRGLHFIFGRVFIKLLISHKLTTSTTKNYQSFDPRFSQNQSENLRRGVFEDWGLWWCKTNIELPFAFSLHADEFYLSILAMPEFVRSHSELEQKSF